MKSFTSHSMDGCTGRRGTILLTAQNRMDPAVGIVVSAVVVLAGC